ncbi:lysozyme family protein [Virgibacillus sp. NKC19-16]|uniref:lysozyme family protein n=1 Tax=Virgibacillus salidurans TaxID=2831673 RepID=UPI001F35927F|nr:lysozyme family protein [Virgibacillus sp. NKC19-16]UJL46117.1 lysozyme family protein [Virgibacillus sp. NKC19-16]
MKLKKKNKKAIKKTAVIAILLCSLFVVISVLSNENTPRQTHPEISEEVENYRPIVEDYADEYGVLEYVDVILGMMMQESGGRGNDPMQSSESYCGERGCIDDPKLSIKQGVYYFAENLSDANGDLGLAVQSYNFGSGFIDYARETSGDYSQETAIAFSQEMYENVPNQSDFRCLREEAEQLDACYGDIYYVQAVMEYTDVLAAK